MPFSNLLLLAAILSSPAAAWQTNYEHLGALMGPNLESSPVFYKNHLYIMESQMGTFYDGGSHSFFCIFDMLTGEKLNCPLSSVAHAFCSAMVDSSSPQGETLWVFCSAWDRANKTSCSTPGWGCGACANPAGGCYVGSFRCSSDDLRECGDSWNFTKALPLPGKVTVPNVAVAMVPRTAPHSNASLLPVHQAFMALETSFNLAVNVGSNGDLSANWILLDPQTHAIDDVGNGGLCPFARYNPSDGFYYVGGGGAHVNLARSQTLLSGSWESPTTGPAIAVGCTDRLEDCTPPSPVSQIAQGFYTGYWANGSDHGERVFLDNLTDWNWSVNDADVCDNGTHTHFIYGQCAQTAPKNFTGKGGGL